MKARILLFFAYVRCINFRRLFNYLKLHGSFLVSRLTGKLFYRGNAYAVTIETAAGCNFRCPGCETGAGLLKRSSGIMSIETFSVILEKLPSTVFHVNLHFQGEPLLNQHIAELVAMAHRKKLFTSFSTNAHLLNQQLAEQLVFAGLRHIIISIDGHAPETYSQYRVGGDFNRVLNNIQILANAKKFFRSHFPVIEAQTVVMAHNENHLHEIRQLVLKMGADFFTTKSAYVIDTSNVPEYLPTQKGYLRYRQMSDGTLKSLKKTPRFCFRTWSSCVVLNDLNVVPCCFDKQGIYIMGNLLADDFSSIFRGKAKQKFMQQMKKGNQAAMCSNCV